jgi:hypothetical protein
MAKRGTPAREIKPVSKARESAQDGPQQPLRLPFHDDLWSDGTYVAPVAFLRSALFGIVPKGRRRRVDNEPLASRKGLELRFTGSVLDQFDEDVWLVMLRQAREHGMGPNVYFTMRSMMKQLSWDASGKSSQRLRASFLRLASAVVQIESPELHYIGHLVEEIIVDKTNGENYYYRLSPRMAQLFGPDQVGKLEIDERTQIKGPLAKWLHGYIAADPFGFPVHIDELRKLSGSTTSERYRFTASLRLALEELKNCGVLKTWRIEHLTVFVTRHSRALASSMVYAK